MTGDHTWLAPLFTQLKVLFQQHVNSLKWVHIQGWQVLVDIHSHRVHVVIGLQLAVLVDLV